jgi:hypothetical protein
MNAEGQLDLPFRALTRLRPAGPRGVVPRLPSGRDEGR